MRFDSLLSPNWDDAVLEYSTILECMLNRALKKKRKENKERGCRYHAGLGQLLLG